LQNVDKQELDVFNFQLEGSLKSKS